MINYGGCWTVLLLELADARSLFDWTPTDADMEFELEYGDSSMFEHDVIGPPPNAPASLAAGRWAVGLGLGQSSDVVGTPDSGGVLCVREFQVATDTRRVEIHAVFKDPCRIDVTIRPPLPWTGQTGVVPDWTPPPTGDIDDCHNRRALVKFDPDVRPWYEDIDTGERIEIGQPWLDGATAIFDQDPRVVTVHGTELRENDLADVACVFKADGVLWVGNSDEPWEPWYRALPDSFEKDPVGTIRSMLEFARGHRGGVPPAAVALTSPSAEPDRATLRALDSDIRAGGDQRWSRDIPMFWLGHAESMTTEVPGTIGTWRWVMYVDDADFGQGDANGWTARHAAQFETPAGNQVSVLDETMTIWEDCAKLEFPPISPGPIEPGYEAGIDPDGELVQVWVDDADGDGHTLVVASYADPACRAHPILGPIIDRALAE